MVIDNMDSPMDEMLCILKSNSGVDYQIVVAWVPTPPQSDTSSDEETRYS